MLLLLLSFIFAREVDFAWEAIETARAYQIQVSDQIEFENIIEQKLSLKPQISLDLPLGQMYYRVRAVDKNKKPGIWSKPESLIVKPFSLIPEIPKENQNFILFEKNLSIDFKWSKSEGEVRYELLITKESGEQVLKEELNENQYTWQTNQAGYFSWQVRSIHDSKHISDYSRPREFGIQKRDMGAPLPIKPEDKATLAAYRKLKFQWEYFPPSNFSYLIITGEKEEIHSTEDDFYKLESLGPGEYKWQVASSESKDSPKVYSEWRDLIVSEEMISNIDHYMGMRLTYKLMENNYNSRRVGADSLPLNLKDNFAVYEWYANYQMTEHIGLTLNLENADSQLYTNSLQALVNFRFGTDDYRQSFVLGIRQAGYLEYWRESGIDKYNDFSGRSFVAGLNMLGRLPKGLRLHIDLLYASPSSMHGSGDFNGDQFFSQVGLAKKLKEKFWLSYFIGYERSSLKIETDQEGKTSWKSKSFSPLKIALEYRH